MDIKNFIVIGNGSGFKPSKDGYYVLNLRHDLQKVPNRFESKIILLKDCLSLLSSKMEMTSRNNYLLEGVKKKKGTKINLNLYFDSNKSYEFISNAKLNLIRLSSSIPVIGFYKNEIMTEIITGQVVTYKDASCKSKESMEYFMAHSLSSDIVKSVLKNITEEDIVRYTERLNEIVEEDVEFYKKLKLKNLDIN